MRLFCLVFFRGFFSRFGFFVSGFTLIAAGFGFAVVIAFLGGFFVVFAAVIVFGRGFLVIGFVVVVVFVRFYIAFIGLFAFAGFVVILVLGFVAAVFGFAAVFFFGSGSFAVFGTAVFSVFGFVGFFSGFGATVFAVGFVVIRFVAAVTGFVFGCLLAVACIGGGFATVVGGFFLALSGFLAAGFGLDAFYGFACGGGFTACGRSTAAGFDVIDVVTVIAGHAFCGNGHGRGDHCGGSRCNDAHVVLGQITVIPTSGLCGARCVCACHKVCWGRGFLGETAACYRRVDR